MLIWLKSFNFVDPIANFVVSYINIFKRFNVLKDNGGKI